MSVLLRTAAKDAGAGVALQRLADLGRSPLPLFRAIAAYGENSTRERFKNQTGPDGKRWMPSQRVRKGKGALTLVLTGRLLRSITHRSTSTTAEWGTNVVYAGIHNFGGDIERLAFSSTLRLRTSANGRLLRQKGHEHLAVFAKATHKRAVERRYTVGAHKINMPARPYLGVNADDAREFLQLADQVVSQAAGNGGGA